MIWTSRQYAIGLLGGLVSACALMTGCAVSSLTGRDHSGSTLGVGMTAYSAAAVAQSEHVFLGTPTIAREHDPAQFPLLERQGYIVQFDTASRVPRWVAYHVTADLLEGKPPRSGRFSSFRMDPNLPDLGFEPVRDADYVGLLAARGFARGHLAPFAVMGGDRDGDGQFAIDGDDHDQLTVIESNYLSNVAPQHHFEFNGAGGLWFKLERWIQDTVVKDRGIEVWVIAGCIFGDDSYTDFEAVGLDTDIYVPAMFYKVVVRENPDDEDGPPLVLAFLFPHQRSSHGDIEDFLTSIDVVEQMAGMDFFPELDDDIELVMEDEDTWDNWSRFLRVATDPRSGTAPP